MNPFSKIEATLCFLLFVSLFIGVCVVARGEAEARTPITKPGAPTVRWEIITVWTFPEAEKLAKVGWEPYGFSITYAPTGEYGGGIAERYALRRKK